MGPDGRALSLAPRGRRTHTCNGADTLWTGTCGEDGVGTHGSGRGLTPECHPRDLGLASACRAEHGTAKSDLGGLSALTGLPGLGLAQTRRRTCRRRALVLPKPRQGLEAGGRGRADGAPPHRRVCTPPALPWPAGAREEAGRPLCRRRAPCRPGQPQVRKAEDGGPVSAAGIGASARQAPGEAVAQVGARAGLLHRGRPCACLRRLNQPVRPRNRFTVKRKKAPTTRAEPCPEQLQEEAVWMGCGVGAAGCQGPCPGTGTRGGRPERARNPCGRRSVPRLGAKQRPREREGGQGREVRGKQPGLQRHTEGDRQREQ